ncbi:MULTISPECIES: tRNA (guanine(26)-N(2))-dimethyltransferase [Metallosphaera]|uniref:tRNA (guanine(26)-N(2))-dimethyltransferase n=3 Tax=Metallosphaera TaxID=41980 RepID=TRM1_METS5|nr:MULTISPECIES: tRNA (guanine(26)-N(2))-dimethyltransferase [Metallosphaera]A4YHH9.1 RecName: Full=tRNA (guanine(26)-N(2))-dimethyltransferase; AltName: Full=tRNA 2,2-dimethylguanosine-26 methyltransferase; AltName: Full=tRNA(guanine-26,N(2)-N(2)) methyltransferase; AltName: Full=tRNA(m(2,2)G26)dimethyltransferase [Metallosphaera sedula DSM 5348]ABP95881.1 N(2),N(2)-dimethylguanosine tRNA methyltransferase [Metallosphaera sedula DSM 5348]AIM27865.1 N(2),N(2)-dimethylguanosine tRNA methyltransfe
MKLTEVIEGKARLVIPDPSEFSREGKFDPAWSPVFYNPRMVFNRDVSVLAVSVISPPSVLDAMSATGVRGIRYVKESGVKGEVLFNDKNPVSVELISKNLELNGITGKVLRSDANSLMHQVKVGYTDLDPFGSPAPYLFSAISSLRRKGVLGVTATDLSALEGKSRTSSKRKYGVQGSRLSYSKEAGLRVLLGKIVKEASVQEKGIRPLMGFYHDYYYRLFVKMEDGAKRADRSLESLGTLYECDRCGYSFMSSDECERKCPVCGGELKYYGPAWIGEFNDLEFLKEMKNRLTEFSYLSNSVKISELLEYLERENRFGPYYRVDVLASRLKVNMPPMNSLLGCLGDAVRTHFDPRGFKSFREFSEILECVKGSSATYETSGR